MDDRVKRRISRAIGGTFAGLGLGTIAGVLVAIAFYLVRDYQMRHQPQTAATGIGSELIRLFGKLVDSVGGIVELSILPAVCIFFGAMGGAVTGFVTSVFDRGKWFGASMGMAVGTYYALTEWLSSQPTTLRPFTLAAIPLLGFTGWLVGRMRRD